ncbi:hypothetical protein HNQ92_001833 [Rhabdobacter roseus]|uniref:Uncharacterized protein n=1 Tax=Rhabdobacter roseus TaxID=1655419 RepID=A0A840TPQ2_9BACT|nr:hypothetical protein [Rhabdobacter roseus]MBB5283707.1 hypothetical protein [Rhabdobacter roseus]
MPKEIIYYGEAKPLPEQIFLQAGPWQMVYENGAIRYIKQGDAEVLRMVYAAVRDQNWGTVEPEIKKQYIEGDGTSFSIRIAVEYKHEDIHFVADYQFTGSATGVLRFEMHGKCMTSFKKNRIGFCVLHPIHECAGHPCIVTEANGKVIATQFPEAISPDQPFKNLGSIQWNLPNNNTARLTFKGDLFETEDQRNWTDASFKTYCTPLSLPFPAAMHAGEEVHQEVELTLLRDEEVPESTPDPKPLLFTVEDHFAQLPRIGVGRSTEVQELSVRDVALIKKIGFHHYRADIEFYKAGWQDLLITVCKEAKVLGLPLELALHVTETEYAKEIKNLCTYLTGAGVSVYSFLLFQENQKATPANLIEVLSAFIRSYFPSAKIGGGTNAYFAELNRHAPPAAKLDFLTYSLNPQVHAFDNLSLVETLEAQGDTVESARRLAPGKAIHVSPVTLKPRFNPNATAIETEEVRAESGVDTRQMSLFGAGWTLGSIKYLAEAGTQSTTYYETVGQKGLLLPQGSFPPGSFPAAPGFIFPMFAVFQFILEEPFAKVIRSKSSHPLVFDGIALKRNKGLRLILSNLTVHPQEVSMSLPQGTFQIRYLDESLLKNYHWLEAFTSSALQKEAMSTATTVVIPPYGLVFIDINEPGSTSTRF